MRGSRPLDRSPAFVLIRDGSSCSSKSGNRYCELRIGGEIGGRPAAGEFADLQSGDIV
jgi:hypothetical protein